MPITPPSIQRDLPQISLPRHLRSVTMCVFVLSNITVPYYQTSAPPISPLSCCGCCDAFEMCLTLSSSVLVGLIIIIIICVHSVVTGCTRSDSLIIK